MKTVMSKIQMARMVQEVRMQRLRVMHQWERLLHLWQRVMHQCQWERALWHLWQRALHKLDNSLERTVHSVQPHCRN
jgi:hypothetical protein